MVERFRAISKKLGKEARREKLVTWFANIFGTDKAELDDEDQVPDNENDDVDVEEEEDQDAEPSPPILEAKKKKHVTFAPGNGDAVDKTVIDQPKKFSSGALGGYWYGYCKDNKKAWRRNSAHAKSEWAEEYSYDFDEDDEEAANQPLQVKFETGAWVEVTSITKAEYQCEIAGSTSGKGVMAAPHTEDEVKPQSAFFFSWIYDVRGSSEERIYVSPCNRPSLKDPSRRAWLINRKNCKRSDAK